MTQLDLLSYVPPVIYGDRQGETFDRARDGKRLNAQAADVFSYMRHGQWRTLADIAKNTGHPEASVSARLRDIDNMLSSFKAGLDALSQVTGVDDSKFTLTIEKGNPAAKNGTVWVIV